MRTSQNAVRNTSRHATLAEIYEFSSGLSKPRAEFGFGEAFVSFKDVFYNWSLPTTLSELVNSSDREQARCSVMRGDVFLTRTSETFDELGMSSVALQDYPCATFNGFTKRLRPIESSGVFPEYAVYWFRSREFREAINAMATMSTRASLNNEMLARLPIRIPPLPEQKRIAGILGALDDKIEANRRMNETLEGIARALFKSWFVDFDPVHAKAEGKAPFGPPFAAKGGKAAKGESLAALLDGDALAPMRQDIAALFPDSFEDSPLGPIPKGWEVKAIDEIGEFLNGLALQKFPALEAEPSLPVIRIGELRNGITTNTRRASFEVPAQYVLEDGDVIFSWSGSLLCRIWTLGAGALNQHLFKVTSADYPLYFVYNWVLEHLPEFQHIAASKATTMGHIKRTHLSEALCVVPREDVLAGWLDLVAPLYEDFVNLEVESRKLMITRDALLPRLLAGEMG